MIDTHLQWRLILFSDGVTGTFYEKCMYKEERDLIRPGGSEFRVAARVGGLILRRRLSLPSPKS